MVNDFNERDINRSPKINKLPSVSEDNQTNQKTSGRFKVKNIFSRKSSSKSDDEGETVKKRPISSGSLSNLTELANTKKILSLSEISSAFTSMLSKHDDSHNKSTDSVINYPKSPSNRENDDKSCDKTLTPIKPEDNPLNGSMEIDTETYKRYRFHYETDTSDEKDNSPKTSKTGTIKKLQALISPKMKRQHEDNSNNDSDQSLLKSKNKLSKSDTQKESFEELNRNLKPNLENLILEFTPILPKKSPSTDKEFKCVRLRMVEGDIGLSIAPSKALHNNSFCYIITDIAPASIAAR